MKTTKKEVKNMEQIENVNVQIQELIKIITDFIMMRLTVESI